MSLPNRGMSLANSDREASSNFGRIACDCRHETVRSLMMARLVCGGGAPGIFDQLAQRHRRTARLFCEPFPMAREQGDLARQRRQSLGALERGGAPLCALWNRVNSRAEMSSSDSCKSKSICSPVASSKMRIDASGLIVACSLTASATRTYEPNAMRSIVIERGTREIVCGYVGFRSHEASITRIKHDGQYIRVIFYADRLLRCDLLELISCRSLPPPFSPKDPKDGICYRGWPPMSSDLILDLIWG